MLYRQSLQTFIQNSRHPPTTIQNSCQPVLMGYNTDLRNLPKSHCCENVLNFWQTVCAILSQCRVLDGVQEKKNPMHWQSMKSGSSTAFSDSASIPTATKSWSKCLIPI